MNVSGQHIAESSPALCMYQSYVLALKKDHDARKQGSIWEYFLLKSALVVAANFTFTSLHNNQKWSVLKANEANEGPQSEWDI